MALANYADLQAAIPNWLVRPDLASGGANVTWVPEIIAIAESRINTDLRVEQMGTTDALVLTVGNTASTWDVATKIIRSIRLTTFQPPRALTYIAPENLPMVQDSGAGQPEYYTIRTGLEWERPPDQAYNAAIEYFPRLNLASTSTNWLMTALPNIYLWASLTVASMRANDNDAATKWLAAYNDDLPRARRLIASMAGRQDAKATFDVPVGRAGWNVMTDN